ncbi:hypothetical protein THERMOT_542 [Bathymodiolus thermophilus thioautotrophic gill symbiont]|nr:hypothetical protein THERMOT_542 [Bathymodiolus thermophilus thioautotrophic gill symbiont]
MNDEQYSIFAFLKDDCVVFSKSKIEDPCIKLKNPTKNHKSTPKTLCKH